MSGPIETAPLTCGTCGERVDEGRAWQRWPDQKPWTPGHYLVLMSTATAAPPFCGAGAVQAIGFWQPTSQCWLVPGDVNGIQGARPLAWRPLPRLPEWAE